MPKISVEIEWDSPNDPFWLNPDNVCLALSAYCPNTHFDVRDLTPAEADGAKDGCPFCGASQQDIDDWWRHPIEPPCG
jgi:hypothetical protein